MVGVLYQTQIPDDVMARVEAIEGRIDMPTVVATVAAIAESQTRRRIKVEKTAPDGEPWADWSPAYAETRHGGHSLLESQGHLEKSIFAESQGDVAQVGSNLIQALTHQEGSRDGSTPARPYLGLSAANEDEMLDVMVDYLEGLSV